MFAIAWYMELSIAMGIQNGWFIRENTSEMDDDWGYPYFRKSPYRLVTY